MPPADNADTVQVSLPPGIDEYFAPPSKDGLAVGPAWHEELTAAPTLPPSASTQLSFVRAYDKLNAALHLLQRQPDAWPLLLIGAFLAVRIAAPALLIVSILSAVIFG